MEECASGFAEHPTGYFIDQGGALGVMIWPVHTVGIPSGRGFHQVRRVSFEQYSRIAELGSFVDLAPRGSCLRAFGYRQFPDAFEEDKFTDANARGNITEQMQIPKVHHILPTFTHP
jgi:hypothetical protein